MNPAADRSWISYLAVAQPDTSAGTELGVFDHLDKRTKTAEICRRVERRPSLLYPCSGASRHRPAEEDGALIRARKQG
jgi:hypothetical protein